MAPVVILSPNLRGNRRSFESINRLAFAPEQGEVDESAEGSPDQRRDPEHPQFGQCPASREDCRAGAPSRIHRNIRHRNPDEVNQRETQSDRGGSESRP